MIQYCINSLIDCHRQTIETAISMVMTFGSPTLFLVLLLCSIRVFFTDPRKLKECGKHSSQITSEFDRATSADAKGYMSLLHEYLQARCCANRKKALR